MAIPHKKTKLLSSEPVYHILTSICGFDTVNFLYVKRFPINVRYKIFVTRYKFVNPLYRDRRDRF